MSCRANGASSHTLYIIEYLTFPPLQDLETGLGFLEYLTSPPLQIWVPLISGQRPLVLSPHGHRAIPVNGRWHSMYSSRMGTVLFRSTAAGLIAAWAPCYSVRKQRLGLRQSDLGFPGLPLEST